MFISVQFILALMTFALGLALAATATFAGYQRCAQARATGERAGSGAVLLLISGGWALCVLGLVVAIVLGISGFSLIEGAAGSGGD